MKLKARYRALMFLLCIKRHIWCRFFHKRDRCYPEVWKGGDPNAWHCCKCVPCGTFFDLLEKDAFVK